MIQSLSCFWQSITKTVIFVCYTNTESDPKKFTNVTKAMGITKLGIYSCGLALLILTISRMTLSKVSFSDILRNDYWDHFDTFGENFDFDTFKNDTFESV